AQDENQSRAQAMALLGDAGLGASSDAHAGGDGANADDDSEHREDAPELVHSKRSHGNAGADPDIHASTSSSVASVGRRRRASIGSPTSSSAISLPSRKVRTRRACRAMSGS